MRDDLETAIDALRAAALAAVDLRPDVTPEYLALVRELEALPQNAPGTDKTAQLDRGFAAWAHEVVGPLPRRA